MSPPLNPFPSRVKERGAVLPVVAGGLLLFLGLLAFSVDLGLLYVAKNELQNIADAAALAGANKLLQATDPNEPNAVRVCIEEAKDAALRCAAENRSSGQVMQISRDDIVVGKWDLTNQRFFRTGPSTDPNEVNAVQVTVKRKPGSGNPLLASVVGSVLGQSHLGVEATAVAYLGPAGTSSVDLPLALPKNAVAGQGPYTRHFGDPLQFQRIVVRFGPKPAVAADYSPSYIWKDLGGNTLDTTRASFVMPRYEERTDLSKLQKYIKGPALGGLPYPQLKVGDKVYPISEWKWTTNVYDNFKYLRDRFNAAPKVNGKWRVTLLVYDTKVVSAQGPENHPFRKLARWLEPPEAYACTSYTVPAVYVQGFVTADIKSVTLDTNCKSYAYPDDRSCYKKCSVTFDIPLNQHHLAGDPGSGPQPKPRTYKEINPDAQDVAVVARTARLVK